MKKVGLFIALVLSLLALSSCNLDLFSDTDNPLINPDISGIGDRDITVKFVIDGSEETKTFSAGNNIEYPTPPEKKNYIFSGWYYDEAGTKPAYLGTSYSENITLYAVYSYDYASALNEVSDKYIKACIGIQVIHTRTGTFGNPVSTNKVTGSGVIFKEENGIYYALTNCHVVDSADGYNRREYSVIDCYGNSTSASVVAMDSNYDLAIISFEKSNTELCVLEFAEGDALKGDVVIAVGSPGGLDNNITFGKVTDIKTIEKGETGYLAFPVIWHDAPMDHGSSGGVLMNSEFKIAAVNYAVGTKSGGEEFVCGVSVPVTKVLEFINANK